MKDFFFIIAVLTVSTTVAQEIGVEQVLTREERAQLARETDLKDSLELLIKFSTARLMTAFLSAEQQQYDSIATNINNYRAICRYVLEQATKLRSDKDKKRVFKKLEQRLRTDLGKLEDLRYNLPQQHCEELEPLIEDLALIRDKALSNLFEGFFE
ncbi:MAG: hypothetical protein RMM17_13460 [Acidobacteriota bacterium]|nr:hypothetical protein [Blastocatellia bacterium]MDW8413676.1 hypothetical protein [Acidobacteriota bacterium]